MPKIRILAYDHSDNAKSKLFSFLYHHFYFVFEKNLLKKHCLIEQLRSLGHFYVYIEQQKQHNEVYISSVK
jgi:hypothetical protein